MRSRLAQEAPAEQETKMRKPAASHQLKKRPAAQSRKSMCCRSKEKHLILRGWSRGKSLAADEKVYPRKFAKLITKVLLGKLQL